MSRVPYAISEGMVSIRFSPTHIPTMPSSQPLMTCPTPTKKKSVRISRQEGLKNWAHESTAMVDHGHSLILVLTKSQSEQRRSGNVPRVKFIAVGKKLSGLQRRFSHVRRRSVGVRKPTHIVNLDRIALLRFGDTVRRFKRRFYVQFLWGLLREHEQGKRQRQTI